MITIILVKPRNPNNIGAAARAMANFGLSDLRIVDVYKPNYEEAVSAVGAEDLLKNAKLFDILQDALAGCNYAFAATSLKNRSIDLPVQTLPEIGVFFNSEKGKTAVVFGSEKTGLSNEDIALCDAVLNIPSAAAQPSINLAQAVTLVCYEISKFYSFKKQEIKQDINIPQKQDIEIVLNSLEEILIAGDFKPELNPAAKKDYARDMLKRGNLTKEQLYALKKLSESIKKRLAS
ncbi:tRNA/rRNA methyltransferase [Elusimicrobium posterum]|uniref:RNA methyltransferase n=1 Tax=Elusimicrobium posterum TaxID=3116653 RepID=UPI003C727AB2